MRGLRRVVVAGLVLAVGLGCAGIEGMIPVDPEIVEAPVEAAEVSVLLDAEDPDRARTPEERAARNTALTAYLASEIDFAAWRPAVLDCLAARTATTTEDCATRARSDFAEKPPAEVVTPTDDWKVVVVVDHTFQDSTWSTAGETALASMEVLQIVHAQPGVRSVSVKLEGNEVGPIDFSAQVPAEAVHRGWILGRAGTDFKMFPETADIAAEAATFYGLTAPEPVPADPAAPAPRTGGSRPAPEPVVVVPDPVPVPVPVAAPEPDETLPDRVDLDTPVPSKAGKGKAGKAGKAGKTP